MSKSYKLKDGNYIDSTGIMHNKRLLSNVLNEKVNGTRVSWDTKIQFNLEVGHQALVLLSYTAVLLCWHSGGGFNYNLILGNDAQASIDGNMVTVTRSNNGYFTGTVFTL